MLAALKPEELTFSKNVVTPAGTALGGSVTFVFRSDGTYTFKSHAHDSGLPDYDFTFRARFAVPGGVTLMAQRTGHVEGTASVSPRRNDDHREEGFCAYIRDNWDHVRLGTLSVSKDYAPTGVIGFVQDAAKFFLEIGATAVGAAAGVILALGSEVGQLFGQLGLGGVVGVVGGIAVLAFGGSIVLAVAAGVAVGAMTNALVKQRTLSEQEAAFAATVFGASLPPRERIVLTNLAGLGGRAFTMPGVDGRIYLNLGTAYDAPGQYTNEHYARPGQVLIHELVHAWQIHHSAFLPGTVCRGIVNQADHLVGENVYAVPPPGMPWSRYNLEQQGAIVDEWFARGCRNDDPYFAYVRDNVRTGRL
ncbi:hypothetical protein GCM10023165_47780 [Variovorax defluvii]|uniref:DUF4157 domain-containing protein n=1 Tax=Variovorax defluvii TaxID=913761 RepID=A0ABP8IC69_9BURK